MNEEWNNQYNQGDDNNQEYAFQTLMRNGKPKTIGWSVASLVIGIISVVCCCLGWSGVFLGAGAVVLAIVSRKTLGYFDGMSIAGLVLGIFGFVFGVSMIMGTYMIPDSYWDEFWAEFWAEYENSQGGLGDV